MTLEEQLNRRQSLQRAEELRETIRDYLNVEPGIETGFRMQERNRCNRDLILQFFNASEDDWNSWSWQMRNRINSVDVLKKLIPLGPLETEEIRQLTQRFRWGLSPYYLSLVDFENHRKSPIFKQSVPSILEAWDSSGKTDPMCESLTSPASRVTRRYPDRLIINVTNQCAMYCRHCQRRRNFGEEDNHCTRQQMEEALDYVRYNPEIRDVLITGGDALMLSDKTLDWLLSEVDKIPHVEIKRLGTRAPVTLPQRINKQLCEILEKHPPVYLNTQFNSPLEVTQEAKQACDMLIKAGVVLGNQAVLLKGINDNIHIMKKLNQELLRIRVKPYYIFHAKPVKGTSHFITPIETGIGIMEKLRGHTSGLAVPTYIVNAPEGLGKTPLIPEYLVSQSENEITLRTWENKIVKYRNSSA